MINNQLIGFDKISLQVLFQSNDLKALLALKDNSLRIRFG